MSLKIELLEWAVSKFGENDPKDLNNVREEILETKDPKVFLKKIIVFWKKRIGVKADWLQTRTVKEWREELKSIVGEHVKMHIQSVEGNEIKSLSGEDKDGFFEQPEVLVYNYQFNLEVIQRIEIKEKSHVSPKPKVR